MVTRETTADKTLLADLRRSLERLDALDFSRVMGWVKRLGPCSTSSWSSIEEPSWSEGTSGISWSRPELSWY